jgi:lactoylglutathione lyase
MALHLVSAATHRRVITWLGAESGMTKAIHSMIRVLDEARSVDFYRRAFGMEVADRFPFDSFTLIYLRAPESAFELELTINHDRKEAYSHGQGYGHIAFVVDDAAAERQRFAAEGLDPEPVKEFFRENALMARFFFVTDPDGYRIEILERHGRYH